jgi:hypothetical protein
VASLGAREPYCALGDGVEHRLELSRRSCDDTQDLSRGRFPFNACGKFSLTGFKLLGDALQFSFELTQFGSAWTFFLL